MADFLLSVGVDVGLSYTEMQKDISTLVSKLNSNPPKIKVTFDIDDKTISTLRTQIAEISKALSTTGAAVQTGSGTSATADVNSQLRERVNLENQVKQATLSSAAAKKMADAQEIEDETKRQALLKKSYTLLTQMQNAENKWTAAKTGKSSSAYTAIQSDIASLQQWNMQFKSGQMTADEFSAKLSSLSSNFATNSNTIKVAGEATQTWSQRLGGLSAKFGTWFSITRVIMAAYRALRQMVSVAIDVDTAMTELKKVTDETDDTYNKFLENAAVRAKELGAALSDVVTASADFARLGFNISESEDLADAAIVYKNVGDGIEDISDASESIIATMQAFGVEVSDVMNIVDKFNEVGNNYAISSKGVGDALLRSAAAMHSANNTLDETIALAAASNTIVQDPEKVGTTLKTVSMYLRAAKTEAEDAGESTDGMADSVSELRDEILRLTGNKVDIQIDDDTFKSTYQILQELSKVWHDLSDVSQANILEMVGGKRNSNVVAAILENFSVAEDALATSMSAAGSALSENEKYLDSIQGRISIFKASFQDFSTNLISSDFVKDIVDLGTWLINVLNTVAKIIDTLGGLNTILYTTLSIIVTIKAQAIITGVMNFFTGFAGTIHNLGKTLTKVGRALKVFIAMTTAHRDATAGAMVVSGQYSGVLGKLSAAFNTAGISASTAQIAMGAFVIALIAAIKITDALILTTDEANEKLAESKTEYQSITGEIESLNTELQTTRDRIAELQDLQSKGTLSFTEQTELDRLKQTNIELQRSIQLEKTKQQVARSQQYSDLKDSVDAFKTSYTKIGTTVNGTYGFISESEKLRQLYQSYNENMESYNKTGNEGWLNWAEKDKKKIDEIVGDVIDAVKGLEYIDNPVTVSEKEANAALDFYNDVIDKYNIINNISGAKESTLDRLTTETFATDMKQLRDLGEEDAVTSKMLEDDKYDTFINKAIELGVVSDKSTESLAYLASYFNSVGSEAEEAADDISSINKENKDYISNLEGIESLSDGLDQLDKIYADIKDGEGFDFSSILNNEDFANAFSSLGDSYSDFIETISNSPDDIDACQEAFNNLVSAYITDSGVLKDVTDETRDATVAMLEQKGVSNAATIVDANLAKNKERLRIETELGTDATYEEIMGEHALAESSYVTQQALLELYLTKMLTNENGIHTAGDIDNLIELAKAAQVTTASLERLAKAKELQLKIDELVETGDSRVGTGVRYYRAQIEELLNEPIEYSDAFKVNYSGGSATNKANSKSGSSSQSDEDNWFERQLKYHQHLIAMEQETEADYLKWLNSAYRQAYKEGIIELDDYYKYQEEVYEGLRDLFKDSLSDVEHEISMRENYAGESKKIISLYQGLIKDIEKEIATARKQGLTDEDDYIQELQSKWQDYTQSIKDIREETKENAKDALDELIDYRIDMLKQDVKDEKDILDKKLDNLKEFYDKQKEMLQDQYDEEKYLQDQAEKRKSITDIKGELAMLENDDSAWAQKRKLELQEELSTAEQDLADFEKENALEKALNAIDEAYNSQEAQLQREMDALDEKLNDPNALYNQALKDIKNNSKNQLYYQMLMYNRQYGDGKDETVKKLWEDTYGALNDYEKLFGKLYKGVNLKNETGVKNEKGWDDETVSGTNPNNKNTTTEKPTTTTTTSTKSTAPSLSSGSKVTIKTSATHFGSKSGGVKMASFVPGGSYTVYQTSGNQVLIGRNGVYTGWVNKSDIVGYASGTKHATAGLHELYERGAETLFVSGDGSKYRILNDDDKVLNAKATNFLYDFANSGGGILEQMLKNVFGGAGLDGIAPTVINNEINMGDIIVQGSANERTVSEIRRAQRESVDFMLKEFTKLNK